jgi:phosphatidylglycerophosphate synthase
MITQWSPRQAGQRAAGLVAQLAVLTWLWQALGLGPVGWLTGTGFAAGVWALLTAALHRRPSARLGPADWVTQGRAVLVGGVAALVAGGLGGATPVTPLVALASVALVLDAVDGQVARRTGTASELGARFDMEVDAFLILILSVYVAGPYGAWVLAIGLMRYAFVAAAWAVPWLRAGLPPSMARKTVAAVQGVTLAVASSGLLPALVTAWTLALALVLLGWSFGRDTLWLWGRAPAVSVSADGSAVSAPAVSAPAVSGSAVSGSAGTASAPVRVWTRTRSGTGPGTRPSATPGPAVRASAPPAIPSQRSGPVRTGPARRS